VQVSFASSSRIGDAGSHGFGSSPREKATWFGAFGRRKAIGSIKREFSHQMCACDLGVVLGRHVDEEPVCQSQCTRETQRGVGADSPLAMHDLFVVGLTVSGFTT